MPGPLLIDPLAVDTQHPLRDIEDIRRHNRQRFEMEMLSGIALIDFEKKLIAGYKHFSEEEFWVRGHIPGRPILPGVLQIEAAAQLTSYYFMEKIGNPQDVFIGFLGVTEVKFRGIVVPTDTLVIAAEEREMRSRRYTFYCQGFVREKMVFEGLVQGAPM